MVTTVRVDGLRRLGERMRNLSADINKKVAGAATGAAARVVKAAAVRNINRSPSIETGSLRDAVIMKKLGKRDTNLTSEHIVTVRRRRSGRKTKTKQQTAPHALFVEFGTVNMPAEPFLRPAIEQNKDDATQAMVNKLRERIVKAEAGK